MSTPPKPPGSDDGPSDKEPTSQRARQLFGTKGGARPWDDPAPLGEASPAPPSAPASTSSAPYPRDATYTPRPAATDNPVDDDAELTKLHPNYKLLMRVSAVIIAVVVLIVAIVLEQILGEEIGFPTGLLIGPAVLVALFIAIRVPISRYNARGYQMSTDRLRVVRGVLFHSDTIVPFSRVQHIDVDQGPVERALGIATMTLHTAGSHNASVRLPGLGADLATQMREEIRAHIKRESM